MGPRVAIGQSFVRDLCTLLVDLKWIVVSYDLKLSRKEALIIDPSLNMSPLESKVEANHSPI